MIDTNRFFETCQKMVQNYDYITGKAVNDLGRI
jgi:flagellar basal body rod protein FlgG